MSSKEIIAVDIDDVLSSERDGVRLYINQKYGLNLTEQDYSIEGPYDTYFEEVWGVDAKTAQQWYNGYLHDLEARMNHPVLEGSIDAIAVLQKRYDLVVVTSREDHLVDTTHEWLQKHFPEVFKQIEFKELWTERPEVTKAIICQALGAEYLIDDRFKHCAVANEAGMATLLFGDYGWNRNKKLLPGMTRVKDWPEVLEYFENEAG